MSGDVEKGCLEREEEVVRPKKGGRDFVDEVFVCFADWDWGDATCAHGRADGGPRFLEECWTDLVPRDDDGGVVDPGLEFCFRVG